MKVQVDGRSPEIGGWRNDMDRENYRPGDTVW